MKYFYLNITRLVNVSKTSYISPFKSETKFNRCFYYQFNSLLLPTRRVEVLLSLIVYEHEYIEAKARDIL